MTYLMGSYAFSTAPVPTDWEMLCQQDLCSGHLCVARTHHKAGCAEICGRLRN